MDFKNSPFLKYRENLEYHTNLVDESLRLSLLLKYDAIDLSLQLDYQFKNYHFQS